MNDPCFAEDTKESKICKNEGICERLNNDFKCNCKSEYFGKRCQIINYCVKNINVSA